MDYTSGTRVRVDSAQEAGDTPPRRGRWTVERLPRANLWHEVNSTHARFLE
jgi:hypothetical protein